MKKILTVLLVSLLVLVGCGSKDSAHVDTLKNALEAFQDVKAVDMSVQFSSDDEVFEELNLEKMEMRMAMLNTDVMEDIKLIFEMKSDDILQSFNFYVTDNKLYMNMFGMKMMTNLDKETFEDVMENEAGMGDLTNGVILEIAKDEAFFDNKNFKINEKDGVIAYEIDGKSEYGKKFSDYTNTMGEMTGTDQKFDFESVTLYVKDGDFFGFSITMLSEEKAEVIINYRLDAINDDVNFDFPNFDDYMDISDLDGLGF